ncbi:hypothetical protein FACS1894205_5980 [Alphaproteobacteria bacterium]|nr:hypothetical protein FACS1894205_5980 [Alphaproteobacteria bacterium]
MADGALSIISRILGKVSGPIAKIKNQLAGLKARCDAVSKSFDGAKEAFSGFSQSLGDLRSQIEDIVSTMGALGAGMSAAGASAAGFVRWVKGAADAGEELKKLSREVNWSGENLNAWQYAIKAGAGGSAEGLQKSILKMNQAMALAANGGKAQIRIFDALNVKIRGANGAMRSSEEVMNDVAHTMAKIENPAERQALAMALFGEAGEDMAVLLGKGEDALKELLATGREETGVTDELVESSAAYNDSIKAMGRALDKMRNIIAPKVLPVLTRMNDAITGFISRLSSSEQFDRFIGAVNNIANRVVKFFEVAEDGSSDAEESLKWIFDKIETISSIIETIIGWVGGWGSAIEGLAAIMSLKLLVSVWNVVLAARAFAMALIANPIGLVVAGVGLVVAGLVLAYNKCETFRKIVNGVWDAVTGIVKSVAKFVDCLTGGAITSLLKGLGINIEVTTPEERAAAAEKLRQQREDQAQGALEAEGWRGGGGISPPVSPMQPAPEGIITVDFKNVPQGVVVKQAKADGIEMNVGWDPSFG